MATGTCSSMSFVWLISMMVVYRDDTWTQSRVASK